jgi:hypothetical protein
MLDQPAHIKKRILPLPPQRQPIRHLADEAHQPVPHLDRWHPDHSRRFHPHLLQR